METTESSFGAVVLSSFASELLHRVRDHLDDGGAFGRVIQVAVSLSLDNIYAELLDHPGAGVPDVRHTDEDGQTWAWEVKYVSNGVVKLGGRDIEGVTEHDTTHPRLIAINMDFPVQVWILDASGIEPGELRLSARTDLAKRKEAESLAEQVEELLLKVDVDLIASEEEAKKRLRERAESPEE